MAYSYFDEKLPHLIIIGGGFAGLELVKKLGNKPYRVTLLDKNNYFTFQPMLYQVAAGGIGPDGIAYPLRKVVSRYPNIVFRMTEVRQVDTQSNSVHTSIGEFSYDYLVIAIGAQTNFFGNTVLEANTLQLKSVSDALQLRSSILLAFEKALTAKNEAAQRKLLTFVVVGGGPTGVETAGALAEMKKHVVPSDYKELDASRMSVYLIEASPRVLSSMSEESSDAVLKFLTGMGVEVLLNTAVESYDGNILKLNNGKIIESDTVLWAAGVKSNNLKGIDKEFLGKAGRYKVNEYNKVIGLENVFALGDAAIMEGDPNFPMGHAMIGTPAQQQARHLAKNLIRA
nr:FAD-dependent oxidoreductase [Chitinophagaceae bacterium]